MTQKKTPRTEGIGRGAEVRHQHLDHARFGQERKVTVQPGVSYYHAKDDGTELYFDLPQPGLPTTQVTIRDGWEFARCRNAQFYEGFIIRIVPVPPPGADWEIADATSSDKRTEWKRPARKGGGQ